MIIPTPKMILTPKVRKTLDIVSRITIAVLALSYLVYRVSIIPENQIGMFLNSIFQGNESINILAFIFILLLINVGLEAYKWKLLIKKSENVSFINSLKAVLGGMTVSVFTPNRVGEFVGRVFVLKKTDPLRGILLTIVGSISQLLVTIVFGTISFLLFAPIFLTKFLPDSIWLINGFSFTLVMASMIYVTLYFNISVLHRVSFIVPSKYANRLQSSINAIADFNRLQLLKIVSLSALRYVVFSTQFFLALRLMGVQLSIFQCYVIISLIYLALAAIPSVALSEIGVRGSVSVFLFGLVAGNQGLTNTDSLAVISAATFIWFINIGLPSLAGVWVVFKLKFFRA